jgi:hypothetical protein
LQFVAYGVVGFVVIRGMLNSVVTFVKVTSYRTQLLLVTQGYVISFLEEVVEHRLLKNSVYVLTAEFLEL